MFKNRLPIHTLVLSAGFFFVWNGVFHDNWWLRGVGFSGIQIAGGILACLWLFRAYRIETHNMRSFWLWLGIGQALDLGASTVWLISQVLNPNGLGALFTFSYIVWLIASAVYLGTLIHKLRELTHANLVETNLFNVYIVMITVASIVGYYFIKPVLSITDHSILITIASVSYPVVDLSMLLVIAMLYYMVQPLKGKRIAYLILLGFLAQILADFNFDYATLRGTYHEGGTVDFLYQVAILFVGAAGYYAKGNTKRIRVGQVRVLNSKNESLAPYLSIFVLMGLVTLSYHWDFNVLSFGLLLIFLMVMGRQILVIKKNHTLIEEFKKLAYHDPLTKLNNRVSFQEDLNRYIQQNKEIALLLLDLDRFKVVNDTLGHPIGDLILERAANRLKEVVQGEEKLGVYRLGGDEFVIILPRTDELDYIELGENIVQIFQKPFSINEHEMVITPSIGISLFPEHGETSEELLKHADAAMYSAKDSGKNRYYVFNSELSNKLSRKMMIENGLRKAIIKEQLRIYYQPQIELKTNRLIGVEALLRWDHPRLGWVSPAEFIPIAEETGHINQIGEWVLEKACLQAKQWQNQGYPPISVAVNVSVKQLQQCHFTATVMKTLWMTELEPKYLELEITESVMQDFAESALILNNLKELGIKTSMDDFGKGYSSLYALQKLPLDTMKIDKTFIDDLAEENKKAMVKTIIELGLQLGLKIVAEGIEEENQLESLLEAHCPIGQGYLFSKPLEVEAFEQKFLKEERRINV